MPECQVMVVSKEPATRQVREVIGWRERWLAQRWLPRNTDMTKTHRETLLEASKKEYHSRHGQRLRQTAIPRQENMLRRG